MTYAVPGADESELFDEVRRLMVHDDIHGGYVPVVIGWWDRRGCTHCLECAPEDTAPDDRGYPAAIWADNSAAEGDRCDTCGVSILAAALARAARCDPFPSTCGLSR